MAIDSITPRYASRGATGDLITIAGTGFGAVIVAAWAAAEITCRADDSPVTPLGSQDLVLTPDGGSAETWTKAIYVYNATDNDDAAKVEIGLVDAIYIDGVHVGKTVGGASITPGERSLPFQPDDVHSPEFELVLERWADLAFVASQITAANIAKAMGTSALTTPTRVVWAGDAGNKTEVSIMVVDGVGVRYILPRCRVVTPAALGLATEDWTGIPFNFRAYEISKSERDCYIIQSPQ